MARTDGKVGMRAPGHQAGQMLANAPLAGVVSGIGQGLATRRRNTAPRRSALSPVPPAPKPTGRPGTGVGKALTWPSITSSSPRTPSRSSRWMPTAKSTW